jgi:hypothetical protein
MKLSSCSGGVLGIATVAPLPVNSTWTRLGIRIRGELLGHKSFAKVDAGLASSASSGWDHRRPGFIETHGIVEADVAAFWAVATVAKD